MVLTTRCLQWFADKESLERMHELGSVNLDQILKVEVSKVQAPPLPEKKQKKHKAELNASMNLDNTFNSSLNLSIAENTKNRTFYVFKVISTHSAHRCFAMSTRRRASASRSKSTSRLFLPQRRRVRSG